MRSGWIVLLSLIGLAFGSRCNNGTSSAQTLNNCAWYASDSCCNSAQADVVATAISSSQCGSYSTHCQDQLTLLSCGWICSPNMYGYTRYLTGAKVCANFADKVYSACDSDRIVVPELQITTCTKPSAIYGSGSVMFGGYYESSNVNCFNAGNNVTPLIALVVAAAVSASPGDPPKAPAPVAAQKKEVKTAEDAFGRWYRNQFDDQIGVDKKGRKVQYLVLRHSKNLDTVVIKKKYETLPDGYYALVGSEYQKANDDQLTKIKADETAGKEKRKEEKKKAGGGGGGAAPPPPAPAKA